MLQLMLQESRASRQAYSPVGGYRRKFHAARVFILRLADGPA